LVVLDIMLSGSKVFELIEKIENNGLKKIIVAPNSDFAVEAFRFAATDYLLKPVKVEELKKALKKVQHEILLESSYQDNQYSEQKQEVKRSASLDMVIFHRKGFDVIKLSDIIYCEANTYCTNFYISGKKTIYSSRNQIGRAHV